VQPQQVTVTAGNASSQPEMELIAEEETPVT